jgi:HK97 family phage portal protein
VNVERHRRRLDRREAIVIVERMEKTKLQDRRQRSVAGVGEAHGPSGDRIFPRLRPAVAARQALDIHNASAAWNKALLDNSARPSGAIVYSSAAGALSQGQFDRLKGEIELGFQGAFNAGRPMVLEGGLDWKTIAMTPKDMDFIEARNGAARDIALAFGVPPMLLGIPGDNTYANYAEANKALWRQTVIPLVRRVAAALGHWLGPAFGGVTLVPDLDHIEALAEDRAALWARIGTAPFLTDAEKRQMLGIGDEAK